MRNTTQNDRFLIYRPADRSTERLVQCERWCSRGQYIVWRRILNPEAMLGAVLNVKLDRCACIDSFAHGLTDAGLSVGFLHELFRFLPPIEYRPKVFCISQPYWLLGLVFGKWEWPRIYSDLKRLPLQERLSVWLATAAYYELNSRHFGVHLLHQQPIYLQRFNGVFGRLQP